MSVVLVGVDASESAGRAAVAAARLARALGEPLVVVTAYDRDHTSRREAQAIVDGIIGRDEFEGVDVTGRASRGDPAEVLVRVAEELGAGTIVVGNRRVQGMARILGSVATSVAQHATCDVYIVHSTGA